MSDQKIALLIDCENSSHRSIEGVLKELANYGVINVRHAHGNWRSENIIGWIEKLNMHGIRPIQQFAYTTGKNATDSAMIVDAMDLLYSKNVDAFALMTSDSDFTPLVLRIRESGMPVYGFGERKTPQAFAAACTPFIYTENLQLSAESSSVADNSVQEVAAPPEKKSGEQLRSDRALVHLLRTAVEKTAEDDGWSYMGKVGKYIANNNSSFSPVNYGYRTLSDLIRTSELFKVDMRGTTSMFIMDISK